MAKTIIHQNRDANGNPIASLTPEAAVYDTDGIRLDIKLKGMGLNEITKVQQAAIKSIESAADGIYTNTGVTDYKEFSESKDYAQEDIVRKNGLLYQFTTPHPQGPWTGTDAKPISINTLLNNKIRNSRVINVHSLLGDSSPTTFENAVASIPDEFIGAGLKLIFRTSYVNCVEAQYLAGSTQRKDFENKGNWRIYTDESSIISIKGYGTMSGGTSGVTSNGDLYINSDNKFLFLVKDFVSTQEFRSEDLFIESAICNLNGEFYHYRRGLEFFPILTSSVGELNINILNKDVEPKFYTLEEAVAAVPPLMRKKTLKIRYRASLDEVIEAQYQAGNAEEKNFLNLDYWKTWSIKDYTIMKELKANKHLIFDDFNNNSVEVLNYDNYDVSKVVSGQYVIPTTWVDYLKLKKPVSFHNFSFKVDVNISGAIVGICSAANIAIGGDLYQSGVRFDFVNKKIDILPHTDLGSVPTKDALKTISISDIIDDSEHYILEIGRKERNIYASVTNVALTKKIKLICDDRENKSLAGNFYDYLRIGSTNGVSFSINNITLDAKINPDILVLGDSVSDGRNIELQDSWAHKVCNALTDNYLIAARSGAQVAQGNEFLNAWGYLLKPKMVIASFGVNGGNSEAALKALYENIIQIGAIPVINTIYNANSSFGNITASDWSKYNNYILSLPCKHIRFDIATSANGSVPQFHELNSNYTLTDSVHPDKNGSMLLYERALLDIGDNTFNKITPSKLSIYNGEVVSALSNYKLDGYYNIQYSNLDKIIDKPSGLNASAVLQVYNKTNDVNGIQTVLDTAGNFWSRYFGRNTSQVGEWKVINYIQNTIPKTRWFALGDSITEGYYSNNGTLDGVTPNNYPYYVSLINGYNLVNYGEGGGGYVHHGTVAPKNHNAKELADILDFTECDLVTIAYGVNDWHYSCNIGSFETSTVGDDTMVGNMRYVIEKILSVNPNVKIVIIMPLNSSKYGGDINTNWGLGSSLPTSGTLQSVIDAQKTVCEYYGIQYIDQTKTGVINRFNIQALLPDGLHPAQDGYLQIARYIAKQIMF